MSDSKSMHRPLYIDFELYTDGDTVFKKQFVSLIIENLKELQQSFDDALKQNSPEIFRETKHKINPTLEILNDGEFLNLVDDLSKNNLDSSSGILFIKIGKEIIASLQRVC